MHAPSEPPARPPASSSASRRIALIVASALFMEQLDQTVLATALPAMAKSLHASPLHMSLALTSYMLSLAVFLPLSGKVADRFGARDVFRAAIVVFVLGSVLCGQSASLGFLVFARIVQGIGGAMMVPVGRLVLLRAVPKHELVSAMSWFLVPAMIGPVLGPPVGGFLTTYLSWRWIFYINLPIGVLGIALATRFITDIREAGKVQFDIIGSVLSGLALSCLMFGLEMATRGMISGALAGGLVGIGVVAAVLYWLHARRIASPVLDLALMRTPSFAVSVISGTLFRIGFGAVPFLLPLMLQLGFGDSAARSGGTTFMYAAGSLLMKATAPRVLRRFGFRPVLVFNGVIAMLLLAALAALRPFWPQPAVYALLLVGGFFASLQFTAYNAIAYADLPARMMSAATSFYTTFQQFSLTLGIAVSAAILSLILRITGHASPHLGDFSVTFVAVASIAMLAAPVCLRLPANAGAEMSGRPG